MVRKWSYLININFQDTVFYNKLQVVHGLKVFRATTRFKKFHIGHTKWIRKNYAKRKHKNNWLNLTYITKFWMHAFLKNRQFVRYYQSLGLFSCQLHSTTVTFFIKQLANLSIDAPVFIASCSKVVLKRFSTPKTLTNFLTEIPYTSATTLQTLQNSNIHSISELNPGLIKYDRILYPYYVEQPPIKVFETLLVNFYPFITKHIFKTILLFYKICITLSLFNIQNANNK